MTEADKEESGPLNTFIGFVAIGAIIGGVLWWLNASGLERNVRTCLEQNNRFTGNYHHVYLTEVISSERTRSYPDGTATRRVVYLVEGNERPQTTNCLW